MNGNGKLQTTDGFVQTESSIEGGLLSLDELNNCQVVRSEFISPTYRPKVTLNIDRFVFSTGCIRLFADVEYVLLLTDNEKKRLILLPCDEHDKHSFKWCNKRNDKQIPRSSVCRIFGAKIYEMMHWIPENRYKVQAVYQVLEGQKLIVFNLEEFEMVVPEFVTLSDGKKARKFKKYYPLDWRESFGMTFLAHKESFRVNMDAYYLLSNAKDGSEYDFTFANRDIAGREPSAKEIITRQYRTETPEEDDS